MNSHTPGPWRRVGSTVQAGATDEGTHVMVSDSYFGHGDREETEANARLIAAAPDLLEALRAQRCSQCMPSEPDDIVCDGCRMRRAALAKAEGSK